MNNDLISREALKEAIKEDLAEGDNSVNLEYCNAMETALDLIDLAPTVDLDDFYGKAFRNGEENALKIRCLNERPQRELTEIKHRLNLLIGVLYSNQCISESDLEYIDDSIKKLMKGGAE